MYLTHWSIAQKNNRETEPEGIGWELFKNYLIAKEKFKPDYFLYENNKSAAQPIKDQISRELDTDLMYINSALVSAQNRQRFYVFNWDVDQPEDRGILLKDVLETGYDLTSCDKSYCLTASYDGACAWNTIERNQRTMVAEPIRIPDYGAADKSRPINALYPNNCGGFEHRMFSDNPNKQQVDMIAEPIRVGDLPNDKGEISGSQATRIYSVDGKSVNLVANGGGQGAKTGLYAIPVNTCENGDKARTLMAGYYKYGTATLITNEGFKGGTTAVAESVGSKTLDKAIPEIAEKFGYVPEMFNAYNRAEITDKAPTLSRGSMVTSSCAVNRFEEIYGYATPCEWDENGKPLKATSCADGKIYTVYEVKDGQITIKGKQYPIKLPDGYYIIRKLTVTECCRLQTLPDDYCKAVSNTQAYKGLGNGWTAEVIIHILNGVLKDVPRDEEIIVLSLYDGIGTGRYCLDKMGFTNVKYYAYEIDPYPIKVAMDNYPDIIQCGDAFAVRNDDWKPPQTRSEWLDDLLG